MVYRRCVNIPSIVKLPTSAHQSTHTINRHTNHSHPPAKVSSVYVLLSTRKFLREKRFYSSENMADGACSVFNVPPDTYQCIVLDLREDKHSCEEEQFKDKLKSSVEAWRAQGIRGVSMYIPSALASRIPSALQVGFDFHHARPGYVLMFQWVSTTEKDNFPAYAHHFLGVGGFVVNDAGEVLVLKEKYTSIEPRWKYPGGGADPGEHLATTAKREVKEETGIDAEFVGVLSYRHYHGFRYGCSDFYQACLMKASNTEIVKCDQEIIECRWMTLEELGKQTLTPTTRYILESYLHYLETGLLIEAINIPSHIAGGSHHVIYSAGKSTLLGSQAKNENKSHQ